MDKKVIGNYVAVDLWQKEFSEHSEKAVLQIYATKFGVGRTKRKYLRFSKCLDRLRKIEFPDYEPNS